MSDDYETVEALGHKTRMLAAGDGDPVVVLHGWGGRIESMSPVVRCLAERFRVLAFDLPGFGESAAPPGTWGTPEYAAYIHEVLRALGVDRADFVGHSYGAKSSLYLATAHPEMVGRLVLAGSSGLRGAPSTRVRVKRALSRGARGLSHLGPPGRALKDAVYARIASKDYQDAGDMREILVRVVNEDVTPILSQIKAPTLLVWGAEDDAIPVVHAKRMTELIPDAGLVVFDGAGHFSYLDESTQFCRVVRHFLGAPVA